MSLPLVFYMTNGVTRLCIGEHDVPLTCVNAAKQSKLSVTGWRYHIRGRRYVPLGCAHCNGCKRVVELSEQTVAWSLGINNPAAQVPSGLFCEECAEGYNMRRYPFCIRYRQASDVLTALQRAKERRAKLVVSTWRRFVEQRRRERAVDTLRPFLLHWAFKPDGPLAKMASNSFLKLQHTVAT